METTIEFHEIVENVSISFEEITESISVEITETNEVFSIEFQELGTQGVPGPQGLKGDTGEQGIQGLKGDTGIAGTNGNDGAQGIQGLKGDTGEQGIQGIQGVKGDIGEQGIQGIQGLKGDTGDQGIQGVQGVPGTNGLDGDFLKNILGNNNVSLWVASGNSSQSGSLAFPGPITVGSNPTSNIASTNLASRQRRVKFSSASGAGSMCEHRVALGQVFAGSGTANDGSGFLFKMRFIPNDAAPVSGERFFAGLSQSYVAATNVEPNTLTGIIGIAQLSTDNTQFYLVYGGTAAQTPIALGSALGSPITPMTNLYELTINSPQVPANTYEVTIKNISTGISVTNTISGAAAVVPQSNSLALAYKVWKTNNTTALVASMDIVSIYFENNYN